MTEILKLRVWWSLGWGNSPTLQVLIDKVPEDFRYRFHHYEGNNNPLAGRYWAERDGVVRFFGWHGDNGKGFYGRHFPILMEDGTPMVLKGPWSSNSGDMNKHFPHSMEVSLTDEPEVMEKGHTFWAGKLLVEKAAEAVARLRPELEIRQRPDWCMPDEAMYCIQCKDGRYRPSHAEAVAWGDEPGATNSFTHWMNDLGLDSEEEQDLFRKNWYSPWWHRVIESKPLFERPRAVDRLWPDLVKKWKIFQEKGHCPGCGDPILECDGSCVEDFGDDLDYK